MDKEILIQNIKYLCDKNNISVSQLEKDLSISQGLITRLKKSYPSIETVFDIAQYFKVDLTELITQYLNDKPLINEFIDKLTERTKNNLIHWEVVIDNEIIDEFNNKKEISRAFDNQEPEYYQSDFKQEILIYSALYNDNIIFCVKQSIFEEDLLSDDVNSEHGEDYEYAMYLNHYLYIENNLVSQDDKSLMRLISNIENLIYGLEPKEYINNIMEEFINDIKYENPIIYAPIQNYDLKRITKNYILSSDGKGLFSRDKEKSLGDYDFYKKYKKFLSEIVSATTIQDPIAMFSDNKKLSIDMKTSRGEVIHLHNIIDTTQKDNNKDIIVDILKDCGFKFDEDSINVFNINLTK